MNNKQINELMKLHNACDTLLAETNIKMTKLIDDFNESQEKKYNEDAAFCDTVDLSNKFRELADYVEDYTD